MKMEQIECSETSANINQTLGKHPKDSTLNTKHDESLKSRILHLFGEETARHILFNEDGTDRMFRNVGQYKPDAGETPKR
jgi:hypothetical protein